MEPRYRERVRHVYPSGRALRMSLGSPVTDVNQSGIFVADKDVTIDFLGKKSDHDFFLEKESKSYDNISGKNPPQGITTYREYTDYDIYHSRANPGHIPLGAPTDNSAMVTAMARTNPGRAVVSVPTFIGELKDFPSLVRQGGRLALRLKDRSKKLRRRGRDKEAADAYLAYKFGIAPMISDVQKLMDFQGQTEKRMAELDRLYAKGGMRRRVEIFSATSSTQQKNFAVESTLSSVVRCDVMTITTGRKWCTLRWQPTSPPQFKNDQEKQQVAQKLVFGLNAESLTLTAWNLLPWSWMIDWFSNCGDYIAAHNNAVPAQAVGRCTMTHLETSTSYRRSDSNSWIQGGNAVFTRTSKTRVIGGGNNLEASLPFLSGNQLSILGALAVSRGRR